MNKLPTIDISKTIFNNWCMNCNFSYNYNEFMNFDIIAFEQFLLYLEPFEARHSQYIMIEEQFKYTMDIPGLIKLIVKRRKQLSMVYLNSGLQMLYVNSSKKIESAISRKFLKNEDLKIDIVCCFYSVIKMILPLEYFESIFEDEYVAKIAYERQSI